MSGYECDVEEIEYLRHEGQPYYAKVFKPRGVGPFPAVVEAHGGAWCEGDRNNNDVINRRVAAGGIVVAAVDFRNGPVAPYPGSVADLNYAVRWLKSQAGRFNSAPDKVGIMGTSSGGHLAVLNGLKPNDPRYRAIPASGPHDDAAVPYVVALWPVICPHGRYQYLAAKPTADQTYQGRGGAHKLQEQYWLTQDAMAEGSPTLALSRGDAVALPDILIVQNEADELHPRVNLDQFAAGYRARGGRLTIEHFVGPTYDLLRRAPDSPAAVAAYQAVVAFIREQARC